MREELPSATIFAHTPSLEQVIEDAARTCYRSEGRKEPGSASILIRKLVESGHDAMLEHAAISVRIVCDRGVSHELVRHRVASFAQESTRYCNYASDRFGMEVSFIRPPMCKKGTAAGDAWEVACRSAETTYIRMVTELGIKPEIARSVIPHSLRTEIVVTANPREWRHIFALRCAPDAHPQMREIMVPLQQDFAARWPSLFMVKVA